MKGAWWKLLGALLIGYSLVAGMLVPLGPGIKKVTPYTLAAGQQHALEIEGYNTHFSKGDLRAWLRLSGQHGIAATAISIVDDRHLNLTFNIPREVPSPDTVNALSLIIDHSSDGLSVLPEALFVTGCQPSGNESAWRTQIEVGGPKGFHFPYRWLLQETIRNTFYHVPLWFGLMVVLAVSMWYAIKFLRTGDPLADCQSYGFAASGVLLGVLGILTGAIWARHTWGAYWSFDIKQNMAAVALLIYLAYFILRSSLGDRDLGARYGAVYNVFAFALLIPLLYIIPRMVQSLHPGAGGNPAFGTEDLDNTMRMIFYPAVIGWILMGLWLGQLRGRVRAMNESIDLT